MEPRDAAPPEDEVLRREEHAALAEQAGAKPSTLAVRLSRARARLRVEYVLALRHADLPTPRCRPVLVALSAGDRQRQAELRAGQHLLTCPVCPALAEPLLRRSRWLASSIPWPGVAAVVKPLRHALARHPIHVAAGASAGVAGVAAGLILTSHGQPPAPLVLAIGGRQVTPAAAERLRHDAGQAAAAYGAKVLAVPADEGFWIRGDGPVRVWVELVGQGESPQHVRPGDRVT